MVTSTGPTKTEKPGKVLVLGSGGREHALAWKLSMSPKVETVFVSPGNGANFPTAPVPLPDVESIISFCLKEEISLVVIGPEDLLYQGFADRIASVVPCFGPSREAARLEWSKSYSKEFLRSSNIATPDFQTFTDFESAVKFIENIEWEGIVVKANGLAAGKGVTVARDKSEAVLAAKEMLTEGKFGDAGHEIVVEERLHGDEVSALCFTDGKTVRVMPFVQDYKKLLDGDEGPNTGGMGVIGPVRQSDDELHRELEEVCRKTVMGLRRKNVEYKGVLYVGAMITETGVQVLEYNCRFGDPETQVLMRLMESDFYDTLMSCVHGTLDSVVPRYIQQYICCVVLASEGYPVNPRKGAIISGLPDLENDPRIVVFHAGTKRIENNAVVNGGRVLCVTAAAPTMQQARDFAYEAVMKICFEGIYYRKDIGAKHLQRGVTYEQSGVNIEEGNELVKQIKQRCDRMRTPATDSIGGFSALIDFSKLDNNFGNSTLEVGIDGVGTKLEIAEKTGFYDEIGQDLVAMCANDVLCHCADPVAFLYYYVTGKEDNAVESGITASIERACEAVGCGLVDGELVRLPEVYRKDQWDLVGACVGARPLHLPRLPAKSRIQCGDVLIGVTSNGLHSNGFSLVRRIFADNSIGYEEKCPWDKNKSFAEVLLRGTKLYTKSVLPVLSSGAVAGAAHITGGGLKENVGRILPDHLKAVINCDCWQIPEVFQWIHSVGPVSFSEMMRTLNCGIGMVLICNSSRAEDTISVLKQNGEDAFLVGKVADRARGSDQVVFVGEDSAFHGCFSNGHHKKSSETSIWKAEIERDSYRGTKDPELDSKLCGHRTMYGKTEAAVTGVPASVDLWNFKMPKLGDSRISFAMRGVGAKLAVADEVGSYRNIGQDLVAVCTNELLCCCAQPVAFLDYYVTGKLCKSKAFKVIESIADACEHLGCPLVGGETAEMPGVYKEEQWDLVGACIGARSLNCSAYPLTTEMKPGDVLIGVESSGLHCSGFSLVRRIFKAAETNYSDKCSWNTNATFGDELLRATRLYSKSVLPVLLSMEGKITGVAHIAGGGLKNDMSKILPEQLTAVIDCANWSVPEIFQWLQSMGGVPFYKMMNVFNCGIGLVLACKPNVVDKAIRLLKEAGENAFSIGRLEVRPKEADQVEFTNEFQAFTSIYGTRTAKSVNVAIFISGTGSNMKRLIESTLTTDSICRVVLVVSNREDAKGLKIARNYGVRTKVIPFTSSKAREEFELIAAELLTSFNVNLICLAGFMRILSGGFVKRYEQRILNIHPSLLPDFKGATPVKNALEAGAKQTGCTVHYAAEEVDSGGIVAQEVVPVIEGDTVESLHARIQQKEHELFPAAMHKVAREIFEIEN